MNNFSLKIAAFFCALLLWFYVMSEREYTYTADIPVYNINLPKNISLSKQLPPYIKAEIKGSGKDLLLHKTQPGAFVFDLSSIELGENLFIPKRELFKQPKSGSFKIINIFDDEGFTLNAETQISKEVPIKSRVFIDIAPNYILVNTPKVTPEHITISGARSVVTKIFEAATKEFSINNLKKDTVLTIKLNATHNLVTQTHTTAEISIEVQPLRIKPYTDLTVHLLNTPKDSNTYSLRPQLASITVTGAKEILEQLNPNDISIFIEYNRFSIENKKKLRPTIKIAGNVQSYDLTPKLFELVVDSAISDPAPPPLPLEESK